MKTEFDRALKRLDQRDWSTVRRQFKINFHDYIEIGEPPPTSAQHLIDSNASLLTLSNTEVNVKFSLPELKYTYIREAIYLTHKSGALLRSLDRDLASNQPTYAEITAYTASLFLARVICLLFGVSFTSKKTNGCYWIIDALSGNDRTGYQNNGIKVGPNQLGHQHVWALLKRILRTTNGAPFDPELSAFIHSIDEKSFSASRNDLQYKNCSWTYADIHFSIAADEWLSDFDSSLYANCSPDDTGSYFPILFYMILLRATICLLNDISKDIPAINSELELIKNNIINLTGISKAESWISA